MFLYNIIEFTIIYYLPYWTIDYIVSVRKVSKRLSKVSDKFDSCELLIKSLIIMLKNVIITVLIMVYNVIITVNSRYMTIQATPYVIDRSSKSPLFINIIIIIFFFCGDSSLTLKCFLYQIGNASPKFWL